MYYLGKHIFIMAKFMFYRLWRGNSYKCVLLLWGLPKIGLDLRRQQSLFFLCMCRNPFFVTSLEPEWVVKTLSFSCYFAGRNGELLMTSEGIWTWISSMGRGYVQILRNAFWQLFWALVILQCSYKVLNALSPHKINTSKFLFYFFSTTVK